MLNDDDKKQIQSAYSRYLEQRDLKPRMGQKHMIAHIARSLGGITLDSSTGERIDGGVSVVEAGTGTGKTVAYLLATIPLAKKYDKKLVVATATVALQEQIMTKDLPELLRYSGLSFSYELAKGRGRYMCPIQLRRALTNADPSQGSLGLYPDEIDLMASPDQRVLFSDLIEAFDDGRWEGDRDSWPVTLDDRDWRRVTTDHARCTRQKCPAYKECPFYQAREAVEEADVIVANHDLVLADLALGGGRVLPQPDETIYVFDEGHHLPDKALDHFTSMTRIGGTIKWLQALHKQLPPLLHILEQMNLGGSAVSELPNAIEDLRVALEGTSELLANEVEVPINEGRDLPRFRFEGGVVPDVILFEAMRLNDAYKRMCNWFVRLQASLKDALEIAGADHRAQLEAGQSGVSAALLRAEDNHQLWQQWAERDDPAGIPKARWITWMPDGDLLLCCSPILASNTLRNALWNKCFGAVITSATLTALGSFDRFKMRAGTSDQDTYEVVQSPFLFSEVAELVVPKESVDPTDQRAFDQLLEETMYSLIDDNQATLILFTARRHMEQFYDALPASWLERTTFQGQFSRAKVLEAHKARVDDGQPALLLGLASFAEGLDLPGDYCKRVVLVKLPFAVPDAPVEAQLSEWIESQGGNSFMQITVPDAALKLVQACGRLIRTEQDGGEIILLDRRVVTRRYGMQLLNSLPPYKRRIEV